MCFGADLSPGSLNLVFQRKSANKNKNTKTVNVQTPVLRVLEEWMTGREGHGKQGLVLNYRLSKSHDKKLQQK